MDISKLADEIEEYFREFVLGPVGRGFADQVTADRRWVKAKITSVIGERLEALTAELANGMTWNWTRGTSQRDAADEVLLRMCQLGLLAGARHPLGGEVYRINGTLYGRTDDVTPESFDSLKSIVKHG